MIWVFPEDDRRFISKNFTTFFVRFQKNVRLTEGWWVRVWANVSLFLSSLALSDKVSPEKALALRIRFPYPCGIVISFN